MGVTEYHVARSIDDLVEALEGVVASETGRLSIQPVQRNL